MRPLTVNTMIPLSSSPGQRLPFFTAAVRAGFPSPADDYIDRSLDLNELLIQHPASTFFARAEGDSMIEAGINSGDILIVDRAVEARPGSTVIAALDGELTVKRIQKIGEKPFLVAANPDFKPIEIRPDSDFSIWGVVIYVIHAVT
jgi:DNA polymerase V